MWDGKKVISWTPSGRHKFLKLLVPYLLSNPIIDHHVFYINTDREDDLAFIANAVKKNPKFSMLKVPKNKTFGIRDITYAYEYLRENAFYIRIDDDICFLDKDCIENLLKSYDDKHFMIFPFILNNSICSFLLDHYGIINFSESTGYNCLDQIGWEDWQTADTIHKTFVRNPNRLIDKINKLPEWLILPGERFSCNLFLTTGENIRNIGREFGNVDEERWFSNYLYNQRKTCLVNPRSIACHYSYYVQYEKLGDKYIDSYARLIETAYS
jgi:hypothetical protein